MIFRRPELEKDNPIAPEPYVGPRRRRAMARAAAGKSAEPADMREALQSLAEAAARVVKRLSNKGNITGDLETLRKAVAQAEQTLAVMECPLPPSRLKI